MPKKTCICNLGSACTGLSSGFIICKDVRSGFVELPPTLADVEGQTVSIAIQIRKAYARHLPLKAKQREAILESPFNGDTASVSEEEKLYVALHHFDPSLVGIALTAHKNPSNNVYTIPRTMSREVMEHLEFKCTEKDRIYIENEQRYDDDEYILCPNYPLAKAKLDLRSLVRNKVNVHRVKTLDEDPPVKTQAAAAAAAAAPSEDDSTIYTTPSLPAQKRQEKEISTSTHSSTSQRDTSTSNHSSTCTSPRRRRRLSTMNAARLSQSMVNLTVSAEDGKHHVSSGVGHGDEAAGDNDVDYSDKQRTEVVGDSHQLASPRRKSQRAPKTKDYSSTASSTSTSMSMSMATLPQSENHKSSRVAAKKDNSGSGVRKVNNERLDFLHSMMTPSPEQLEKKMPSSLSNKLAKSMSSISLSQDSDHNTSSSVNDISEQINKLMGPRRKKTVVKPGVGTDTTDVCDDDSDNDDEFKASSDLISAMMSPSPRQIKKRLTLPPDSKVAIAMAASVASAAEQSGAEMEIAQQINKLNSPRRKKRPSSLTKEPSDFSKSMSNLMLSDIKHGRDAKERNDAKSRDPDSLKCSSDHVRSKKMPSKSSASTSSSRQAESRSSMNYDNGNEPNDSTRKPIKNEVPPPSSSFMDLLSKLMDEGGASNTTYDVGRDAPISPRSTPKKTLQQKSSSGLRATLELVDDDEENENDDNKKSRDIDCSQHSEPIRPSKKSTQKIEKSSLSGSKLSETSTPMKSPFKKKKPLSIHSSADLPADEMHERTDLEYSYSQRSTPGSCSPRKKPFEKSLSMSKLSSTPTSSFVKSPSKRKKKAATTTAETSSPISLMDADVNDDTGKKHDYKNFTNDDLNNSSQQTESSLFKKEKSKFERSQSTSRLSSSPMKKRRSAMSNMSVGSTRKDETERSPTRSKSPSSPKTEKTSASGLVALVLASLSPPKSAESPADSKALKSSDKKKSSRKSSSSAAIAVEEKKDASDDDGAIVVKANGGSSTTALPFSLPLNYTEENSADDDIVNDARQFLSELGANDAADVEQLKSINQQEDYDDDDGHCGIVSCSSSLAVLSTDGQSKYSCHSPLPLTDNDASAPETMPPFAVVMSDSEKDDRSSSLNPPRESQAQNLAPPSPSAPPALPQVRALLAPPSPSRPSPLSKVRDLAPPSPSRPSRLPKVQDFAPPPPSRPSALPAITQMGDARFVAEDWINLSDEDTSTNVDDNDSDEDEGDGDLAAVRQNAAKEEDILILLHKTLSTANTDEMDSSTSTDGDIGGTDYHEVLLPPSTSMSMGIDNSEDDDLGRDNIPSNHQTPSLYLGDSEEEESVSAFLASFSSLGGLPLSSGMASSCPALNCEMSESENSDNQNQHNHTGKNSSIFRTKEDTDANEYDGDKKVVLAQSLVRAWLSHRVVRRRMKSIVCIQSTARRHLAEEKVSALHKLKEATQARAATRIQSRVRGVLAREQLSWMKYAASIIQGLVRGVIAREEVALMIFAATTIECLVRGVIARKHYSRMVEDAAKIRSRDWQSPSSEMDFRAAYEDPVAVYDDEDEHDNQSLDLDEAMLTDIHDNNASHNASHYFMYEEHEHQALRMAGGRQQPSSFEMERVQLKPMFEPPVRHVDHHVSSSSLAFSTDGDHHASLAFSTQSLDGERIIESDDSVSDEGELDFLSKKGGDFMESFLVEDKDDCASPLPLPEVEREIPRDQDDDVDDEEVAQLNQLAKDIAKARGKEEEEEDEWDAESSSEHEQERVSESKDKDLEPESLSEAKDSDNAESKEHTDLIVDDSPKQRMTVLASIEHKRRLWSVSELHTIHAQWDCHHKMLRAMSKETARVEALLGSSHRSLALYARSLSAICTDTFIDKKGNVVKGFWQQSLLAVQRKHTAQTTAQVDVVDGYPAILHPFIDAFSSFAARLENHLPFLGKCTEEIGRLSKAIDYRVKVLEEKYLDILMDLKQAENKVAHKWGIVEELHRADSSSDDIWLHEADYRCAVSSKLTIWKQRCWELKRLLADVVELEVHRRTKTRQVLLAFLTKRRLILSKSRELLDPAADELESGRKPRDQVEAAIEESIQLLHVSKLHQQSRTPIFNRARYQLINGIGEVSITAMMTHASTAPLYETSMLKNSLVYEVTPVSFKIGREPKWTYGMAVITTFQHLHLFALTKDDKKTSEDDSKGDNKSNVSMPSLDSTDSSRTDTKNKRAQSGNSGDEEANFNNSSHSEMSINNSAHGGLSSSRDSSSLKRNNGMTRSGSVSSLMSKGLRSSFKRGGSASSLTNSPSKISALTSSPRSNGTSRKGGLSESCPWSEFNLAATSPNNNKNAASVVLADASGMAPMPLCAFDAHHEEALTHKPKACVWLSTCAFGISADGGHVELIPNFDDQAVKIYLRFDEEEGDDDESPSSQCKAATWLRNTQKWAFLASQQ